MTRLATGDVPSVSTMWTASEINTALASVVILDSLLSEQGNNLSYEEALAHLAYQNQQYGK